MLHQIHYLTNHVTLYFGEEVHLTGQVAYDQAHRLLYFITDDDSEVLNTDLVSSGWVTPPGHVWVKDWSEHTGLTSQLINLQVATYRDTALVGPFKSPAHLLQITT